MPHARRAWTVLALGLAAQISGTVFVSAPAFLIPLLHAERGLTLAEAGLLAVTPTIGMVLTLIAWGALADRIGERWVIAGGLALTAVAAVAAIQAQGYVALGLALLLGGAASASTNAASGRVVVGWFPKDRRGLAMGIRQMAQPLGVTITALAVPNLAAADGIGAALLLPAALTAVFAVACAIGIVNPPRAAPKPATVTVTVTAPETAPGVAPETAPETTATDARPGDTTEPAARRTRAAHSANPYRASGFLWRIHAVSVLLVVPQFTLSTFGLVWLIGEVGLDALSAGVVVGVAQFVGAVGRIGVGVWSDRVGSRVRPLAQVAAAASAVMLALAGLGALDALGDAPTAGLAILSAALFVTATTVTVADNGLAFTSVAEVAGSAWAGRALGAQNTAQFVGASLVGPGVGALVGLLGFPLAFAAVALFPAIAVPLVPRRSAEHDRL